VADLTLNMICGKSAQVKSASKHRLFVYTFLQFPATGLPQGPLPSWKITTAFLRRFVPVFRPDRPHLQSIGKKI